MCAALIALAFAVGLLTGVFIGIAVYHLTATIRLPTVVINNSANTREDKSAKKPDHPKAETGGPVSHERQDKECKWSHLTCDELRCQLRNRNLQTGGLKADLIRRLTDQAAKKV